MTLLLSFIPLKFLAGALGLGSLLAGLFIKGKVQAVQTQNAKVATAEKIVENHAVEQKQAAAQTPEDVYAALDADRKSDRT